MQSIFTLARLLTHFNISATLALLAWLATTLPAQQHDNLPTPQARTSTQQGGQQ